MPEIFFEIYGCILTYSNNEKTRWRNKRTIPRKFLLVVWRSGIHFLTSSPKTGMNQKLFLLLLGEFIDQSQDATMKTRALYLYRDVQEASSLLCNISKTKVAREMRLDWKHKRKPRKLRLRWPEKKVSAKTVQNFGY